MVQRAATGLIFGVANDCGIVSDLGRIAIARMTSDEQNRSEGLDLRFEVVSMSLLNGKLGCRSDRKGSLEFVIAQEHATNLGRPKMRGVRVSFIGGDRPPEPLWYSDTADGVKSPNMLMASANFTSLGLVSAKVRPEMDRTNSC